jgi:hypothetical protein
VQVLVEELAIVQIIPCEASQADIRNTLPTPVYVTQARRDAMGSGLVFEANLAIRDDPGRWILQGVALFLNADHLRIQSVLTGLRRQHSGQPILASPRGLVWFRNCNGLKTERP